MAAGFDLSAEVVSAFTKLFQKRNWLLILPGVAGQILLFFIVLAGMWLVYLPFMGPIMTSSRTWTPSSAQIGLFVTEIVVAIVAATIINSFAYAWTMVSADPVWAGGDPAFDRGFNRAVSRLLQIIAFQLLVLLMLVVSLITIVGPVVVAVFALYGIPFIVIGNRSALQAIGDSFRLVVKNPGETLGLVLAFILAAVAAFVPEFILGLIPGLGVVAQLGIAGLINAFTALAVLRVYSLLTIAADVS